MMEEYGYKIAEPEHIATSNHSSHGWVLRLCVFSSVALSFGGTANSESLQASNNTHGESILLCEKTDVAFSDKLVSELNLNAEIKERLISRLMQFKNELKKGWNGNAELPMEEQSVSNALAAVEATSAEEFAKWTVFPSTNGTILFSPTDNLIAGISVGNDEFSYAAIGNRGQEIKGKEGFSVSSFKLALRLINSMNEA